MIFNAENLAVPKKILKEMGESHLTRENIASHLQVIKYFHLPNSDRNIDYSKRK